MSESAACCAGVLDRSSGSATATNVTNERISASEPRVVNAAASFDADRLDSVADLDRTYDIDSRGHLAEVGVLRIQEVGVLLHDKPLCIVVDRRILPASNADRADLERKVVVFGRHLAAPGAGPERIPALHHPVFDPMEREVVVEATARLLREAGDGLRRLVGSQRECERAALRELDGGLVRRGRGRGTRARRLRGRTSWRRRAGAARGDEYGRGRGAEERATVHPQRRYRDRPMPTYQAPRGMRDLLPEEAAGFDALQAVIQAPALRYGYPRIDTPIAEDPQDSLRVFCETRPVG